ncbi:MAG TPA: Asp-tRNA(Asn)/Glu-tRNA(Gln) amidotransferase GatCAB subunit B, partial [Parvibaculum sp.]
EGGKIAQETRLFDPKTGETRAMRSKEEAHDYRYFPDPDPLPLEIAQADVDRIAASLPELPDEKKARLMSDYALSAYDATVLVGEIATADYYEAVVKGGKTARDPKLAANWVTVELFGMLNREGHSIETSPVSAERLGELIDLISDDTISGRIAKQIFDSMYKTGRSASEIVEKDGLRQVTDSGAIEAAIDAVIAANPEKAEQAKAKPALAGWFVGQVMKSTSGKANPQVVNEILARKLGLSSAD